MLLRLWIGLAVLGAAGSATVAHGQTLTPLESLLEQEWNLMRQAEVQPNSADLKTRLASVRAGIGKEKARQGDYAKAVDYLTSSVKLDGSHTDRWELLGDLANFLPRTDSAFITQYAYEEALKTAPTNQQIRLKLASSYFSSDRFQKGIAEMEKFLSAPTRERPQWTHVGMLVGAYTAALDIPRGVKFFERLLGTRDDSRFRLALAILEHAQGNKTRALELLDNVSAKEPTGSEEGVSAGKLRQSYLAPQGR